MSIRTHVFAGLAVAALAGSAQADFVRTVNTGAFDLVSVSATEADYTFLFSVVSQIGGLGFTGGIGSATQTFMPPGTPDDFDGIFVLEGPTGADTMTLEFHGFLVGPPGGSHASWAANVEIVGTTGVYAGLSGVGDLSGSSYFTTPTGGFFDGVIQLDVIPAPASVALLGLAGLVGIRRRR